MSTTQRPTFRCANPDCGESFGYPGNAAHTGTIIVTCPYCDKRSKVDLDPFRGSTVSVYRDDDGQSVDTGGEFDFPPVIPTDVESIDDD